MRTNLKIALQRVLDMASTDVLYLNVRFFLEDMDKRAAAGDIAAQKVVDVVVQFSRLIDVAEKGGR